MTGLRSGEFQRYRNVTDLKTSEGSQSSGNYQSLSLIVGYA